MTSVTIHSGLTPKPDAKEPDWEGFRTSFMMDSDYEAIIGGTNVPILAARLESIALQESDNWGLIVDLWTAIKGNTMVDPLAPSRWNELASKFSIPLSWDSSGAISFTL